MKASWTQGLTKEQGDILRQDFVSSIALRMRLNDMLVVKQEECRKAARSKLTYENPNWAYVQADAIGYERAISDIISLILDKSVQK